MPTTTTCCTSSDHDWARDRVDGHQQVDEVEEALADMFAHDYDFEPTIGEDSSNDVPGDQVTAGLRSLEGPHDFTSDRIPDPATMSEYRCGSNTDAHVNATILGHAYHLFVRAAGRRLLPTASLTDQLTRRHEVAGNVLTYIHYALPPAPSFTGDAACTDGVRCSP